MVEREEIYGLKGGNLWLKGGFIIDILPLLVYVTRHVLV
jgi:hypothetical protein